MDVNSLAGIVVGVGLNLVGLGLVYPQALAGGLSCAAERAGAASSLLGGLPPVCSAILGAGIAASAAEKAWPAGLALLAMALVIVGAWLILRLFPQKSRV